MKTVIIEAEVNICRLLGRLGVPEEKVRSVLIDLEPIKKDSFRIGVVHKSKELLTANWATEIDFLPRPGDKIMFSELESIYQQFLNHNAKVLNNEFRGLGDLGSSVNIPAGLEEDIFNGFIVTGVVFEPFYFDSKTRYLLPHVSCISILETNLDTVEET